MSVHGEYSRALETLIVCVRAVDRPERTSWLERLENARVDGSPDLSTAARRSLEALRDLSAIELGSPRVSEALENLRSHCRVILGGTD